MMKEIVTCLSVEAETRSAAAMVKETPVTWPLPSEPESTPTLVKSLLVDTVIPVALPTVAAPNVTPLRVTRCIPAAAGAMVVKTTEDAPVGLPFPKAPVEIAATAEPGIMKPVG